MALQFPAVPSAQTPINEYSPASSPAATTNGVTYTWNGTYWVAEVTDPGDGGDQVGSLQQVTDVGNVTTHGIETSGGKILLNLDGGGQFSDGKIIWNSLGAATFDGNISGNQKVYGVDGFHTATFSNTPRATLTSTGLELIATGGATIAEITSAGRFESVEGYKSTGDYGFKSFSDITGPLFTINNAAGDDPKIVLNGDGTAHFVGDVTSDGSINFNLNPEDSANYDVDGNYTGPTINVKDRLQNLLTRMDAIEANELVDDATDSSMLTLLASAASRLDAIEARLDAAGI